MNTWVIPINFIKVNYAAQSSKFHKASGHELSMGGLSGHPLAPMHIPQASLQQTELKLPLGETALNT